MRKQEKVIEVTEDIELRNGFILEKGDKIQVVNESTSRDVMDTATEVLEKSLKSVRNNGDSMVDEAKEIIRSILRQHLFDEDFEDLDSVEVGVSEDSLEEYFEDADEEMSSDDCLKWLGYNKGRMIEWVDNALDSRDRFDNFTDLVNKAKHLCLTDQVRGVLIDIESDINYLISWEN